MSDHENWEIDLPSEITLTLMRDSEPDEQIIRTVSVHAIYDLRLTFPDGNPVVGLSGEETEWFTMSDEDVLPLLALYPIVRSLRSRVADEDSVTVG